MMHEVSVVIPAYNVARVISRAVASAQRQQNVRVEIIVVDDGSRDETVSVVRRLALVDDRIKIVECGQNGGVAEARNRGIEASRAPWIAVLDADDMWRDDRLEKLLLAAERSSADIVADNQIFFDEAAQKEVGLGFDPASGERLLSAEGFLDNDMTGQRLPWGMLKPVFRREILGRVRYRKELGFAEDFLFALELLLNEAKYILIGEAYYVYTSPVGKISGVKSTGSRTRYMDEKRLWIHAYLRETYAAEPGSALDRAITRYLYRAQKRLHFQEFTRLRQERRLLSLGVKALRHPSSALAYFLSGSRFQASKRARTLGRA